MKKQFTILAGALLFLVGCGNDEESNGQTGEPVVNPLEKPYVPVTLDAATEQALVENGNEFTFRFFNEMYREEEKENLFISPLSASLALSMTANGAAGNTAKEMIEVLGFSGHSQDEINAFYKKLIEILPQADPTTQIGIAHSIWVDEGFKVLPDFLSVNQACYDAEITNLPFDDAAIKRINDWCADKTNNRITEIIDEIDENTRLFLLNALFFKGTWKATFDKKDTRDGQFTKADGTKIPVKMMYQANKVNFAYDPSFSMIELPYGNGTFSMVILLPNLGVTMDKAIAALTPENWEKWDRSFSEMELEIRLPKFKIEYGPKDLRKPLQALGMVDAFASSADLSKISEESPLYIGKVDQKTFVEVNEEGTEAAAVTIVGIENTSPDPSHPTYFVADRPFVFAIREKSTKAILFIGKVGEPVYKEN